MKNFANNFEITKGKIGYPKFLKNSKIMKTAIMGFGNPVRSDDVIGVYVIEELKKKIKDFEAVTLLDMGTSAFEVLFQLKGHHRIIIVDSVINSGEPVGTLFKLPASEVEGAIEDDPLVFLHSLKWSQGLSYAKKILGESYPSDIQVYLIAIENTKLEVQLSEEVKKAGDRVVNLIENDLFRQ
jgi:hydrogenase maturation protease